MSPETLRAALEVRLRGELSHDERLELARDLAEPLARATRSRKEPFRRLGVEVRPHTAKVLDALELALRQVNGGGRVTMVGALEVLINAGMRSLLVGGKTPRLVEFKRLLDVEAP